MARRAARLAAPSTTARTGLPTRADRFRHRRPIGFLHGKQLREFASGVRNNDTMTPIAKAMTAQDIADVAAYNAAPVPA
jgi:hypothetical protein